MRVIILFGHPLTASNAYMQVDQMLRERRENNIVLAQTVGDIDIPTLDLLRQAGAELWYCGPQLMPPGGEKDLVRPDRYLLADCVETLSKRCAEALRKFLNKARFAPC